MKIEKPGTVRAAAEDSAFQMLGSSSYAYHDRLVHFSAFLEGVKWAKSKACFCLDNAVPEDFASQAPSRE